jgi:ATP-dependent Clp protease adaptor protein ClpS
MLPPDSEHEEAVLVESEEKVERPPLYRVILHNDDYTTMDFVVFILQAVFHRSFADAFRLMLDVHSRGRGVAGVFTYEVAEMKIAETMDLARANEYPLLCTMEEAD